MTNDVRRAYFHAKAMGEIYVELPDEDKTEQDIEEDNVVKTVIAERKRLGIGGGIEPRRRLYVGEHCIDRVGTQMPASGAQFQRLAGL